MYKLIIPGELPDLNQIIDAAKSHYRVYSALKKENTDLVAYLVKKLPKIKRVDLEITWYCKDKRKDKDNITAGVKFILDGLVKAGVLDNDGWKQIGDINHSLEVDKHNPRIEVMLREVS